MSEENIENITNSNSNFSPAFFDHHLLPDINFNGHCLINSFSMPKKVINLYISYTLNPQSISLNTGFALVNCLFGSLKLTKNVNLDKYKYRGYGIGFDSRSKISLPDGRMGKNVISFGADMSSSVHIDNKGKGSLILEGRTNTRIR